MDALRINVAGLLKETAGAAREYEMQVPADDIPEVSADVRPIAPLNGRVRLMRTPRSIFARGRLTTALGVDCSRCLEEAEVEVAFDVEAEYFPKIDIATGLDLPAPDDDLAFTIDANHELDLGEAVRQHLLLELPMQSVCRETCEGLCPRCGANLNEGPCRCEPDIADERMAPLKALLERHRGDPA